jgi:hypothetical protein
MKKELPYFLVEDAFGGSQQWFSQDWWMRRGGCAAVTACDCCIYFSLYKDLPQACPAASETMTRKAYTDFGMVMKPYLKPRFHGINKLSIYEEGLGRYLMDHGVGNLTLKGWEGTHNVEETAEIIKKQIDAGWPLPYLNLKHRNPVYRDLIWHWFLLTGYDQNEGGFAVKVTTYGSWRWLDFRELWQTGYRRRGGLILFGRTDGQSHSGLHF